MSFVNALLCLTGKVESTSHCTVYLSSDLRFFNIIHHRNYNSGHGTYIFNSISTYIRNIHR